MDSVVQLISHQYADERGGNVKSAAEAGRTSLEDVFMILSVHFASALVGVAITMVVLS